MMMMMVMMMKTWKPDDEVLAARKLGSDLAKNHWKWSSPAIKLIKNKFQYSENPPLRKSGNKPKSHHPWPLHTPNCWGKVEKELALGFTLAGFPDFPSGGFSGHWNLFFINFIAGDVHFQWFLAGSIANFLAQLLPPTNFCRPTRKWQAAKWIPKGAHEMITPEKSDKGSGDPTRKWQAV